MNIPLLDLKAQFATIKDDVNRAIQEVLESQHFIRPESRRVRKGDCCLLAMLAWRRSLVR